MYKNVEYFIFLKIGIHDKFVLEFKKNYIKEISLEEK